MIRVENLTKSYGDFCALNNLNLQVDKGSVFGLVGINGSGKTTLLKHLAGALVQDSGVCRIDGQDVKDNIEIKQRTIFIPDELYFFNNYTMGAMASYYRKIYPNWDKDRFEKMLEEFKLKKNGRIAKFSKGMQKQAAFILAMSAMPDVLLLDEPIDGLDPIMRKRVWGYLLGDVADRQMTVLISSHNLRELEGICDSVGILSQGEIKFQGKLDDLKNEAKGMSLEDLFFYEMGGEDNEKQ